MEFFEIIYQNLKYIAGAIDNAEKEKPLTPSVKCKVSKQSLQARSAFIFSTMASSIVRKNRFRNAWDANAAGVEERRRSSGVIISGHLVPVTMLLCCIKHLNTFTLNSVTTTVHCFYWF